VRHGENNGPHWPRRGEEGAQRRRALKDITYRAQLRRPGSLASIVKFRVGGKRGQSRAEPLIERDAVTGFVDQIERTQSAVRDSDMRCIRQIGDDNSLCWTEARGGPPFESWLRCGAGTVQIPWWCIASNKHYAMCERHSFRGR